MFLLAIIILEVGRYVMCRNGTNYSRRRAPVLTSGRKLE